MLACEVKEESPSDSDASSATDANEYMAAADMQVMRCQQDRFNFTQSLINLVSGSLHDCWACCLWHSPHRSCVWPTPTYIWQVAFFEITRRDTDLMWRGVLACFVLLMFAAALLAILCSAQGRAK